MKTWKPTAAGTLSIIAGALSISIGIVRLVIKVETPSYDQTQAFGVICLVLGLIAVIGGIFAIRRQVWGLALAGAIGALFPSHPYGRLTWSPVLGILAIVFLALSTNEFLSSGNESSSNRNRVTSAGALTVRAKSSKPTWAMVIGLLVTAIGSGIELTPLGLIGILVLFSGIAWFVISRDRR